MYNLLFYQIVVQMCVTLTESECDDIIEKYSCNETIPLRGFNELGSVMSFILENTNNCRELHTDYLTMAVNTTKRRPHRYRQPSATSSTNQSTDGSSSSTFSQPESSKLFDLVKFGEQIEDLCLPFLRIASLLRLHLYEQQIPEITIAKDEFPKLLSFLELITEKVVPPNVVNALYFVAGNERQLPKYWCNEIMQLHLTDRIPGQKHASIALLSQQHELWQQPRLLALPKEYEKIFTVIIFVFIATFTKIINKFFNYIFAQYYYEKRCNNCNNIPRESAICLLCGTIVCLKQGCCVVDDCCETVRVCIQYFS